MSGKEAMQALTNELDKGQPSILLGTQMLTKGHHFPMVSLVAVIDADSMLFSTDFRGEERMAQLLTQVAGRAGRADHPGTVIFQTHYPDHPAVQSMLEGSYARHARQLLTDRKQSGMPPIGQLVMMRTDSRDANTGEKFLRALRAKTERTLPPGTALIGPLPSPMPRRAGKFRNQLILTAPGRQQAQQAAALLVAIAETLRPGGDLRWSIDIDPQEVF